MKLTVAAAIAVLTLYPVHAVLFAADQPIPGIGPKAGVVKVQGGFTFTEGPAADRNGNVYFCDIPNAHIHKVGLDGKVTLFKDSSNKTNGLMFDANGRLIACETGGGRLVSIDTATGKTEPFCETHSGKRFNGTNDLVIDRQGGVYFSDPAYGVPEGEPLPQGVEAVYYRAPDGTVTRIIDDLHRPNGVILSPDEKTLYVVSRPEYIMAYPVTAPGKIGRGRQFFKLGGGGDGLTVDTKGNLYVTSSKGIQVISPEGQLLGVIEVPEKPANVTFGGKDFQTLYITARTSLYSAAMESTGHRFAQGK